MQPQTIYDAPVPLIGGSDTANTGSNSSSAYSGSDVYTPGNQVDQKFPPKIVAQQTISESIDTQSRAIKGAYTFEQLGAFRVGGFEFGVSGEILISPDGIVATNVNGDETFALNGATGDAVFSGEIRSGSLVTGDVEVLDGTIIVYENGIPTVAIGAF